MYTALTSRVVPGQRWESSRNVKALKIQSDTVRKAAEKLLQLLFYGGVILFLWNESLTEETGFGAVLNADGLRIFWICLYCLCIIKGLWTVHKGIYGTKGKWIFLALAVTALLIRMNGAETGDESLLFYPVIGLGVLGEEEQTLLKVWFFVKVILIIECYAASMIGLVPYLVSGNGGLGADHAFGFSHKNHFAIELFFMILIGWCAFPKRSHWLTIYGAVLGAMFCHRYVGSDTGTLMLVLTAAVAAGLMIAESLRVATKNVILQFIEWTLSLSFFLCTALMAILVHGYGAEEEAERVGLLHKIDTLMHNRLVHPWGGLQEYGIKAFGSQLPVNTDYALGDYFFLDDSYYQILLSYGWVIWLVVGLLSVWTLHRAAKRGEWRLFVALVLVCIHSIEECYYIRIRDNIWLLLPLCLPLLAQKQELEQTTETQPEQITNASIGLAILQTVLMIGAITLFLAQIVPMAWRILDLAEAMNFSTTPVTRTWWTVLYASSMTLLYCFERLVYTLLLRRPPLGEAVSAKH